MYQWEVEFEDSNDNTYIYDYWKNVIYNVSECFKEVRKSINGYDIEEIISLLKSRFSKEEITFNYNRIKKLEDSNNIINNFKNILIKNPENFLPKLKKEYFEKRIANARQLTIEITQGCNMRCKYCVYSGKYEYERTHSSYTKLMPFDVARKSIDYFFSLINSKKRTTPHDLCAIGFYGGEPLLGFELIKKCVDYIKQKKTEEKISFTITTNGTLLDDEVIDFFIRNDFRILISLDGPKEEHDRFRVFKNNKGTFDRIWENIIRLKKNKEFFNKNVSFAACYSTPHDLLKIDKFFNDNFARNSIIVSFVREMGNTYFKNNEAKQQLKRKYKILFQKYLDTIVDNATTSRYCDALFSLNLYKAINRDIHSLDKRMEGELKIFNISTNCFPGERLFVDTDGAFFVCERVNQYFSIGDYINGIDFEKVKKIVDLYSEFTLKNCLFCEARRFCGLCLSHHYNKNRVEYNSRCKRTRKNLRDILCTYVNLYQVNKKSFLANIYKKLDRGVY